MGLLGSLKNTFTGTPDLRDHSREELLEEIDRYLNVEQSISVILMLEGEKPGVLIMSAGENQRKFIKAFCRKFDFEYMAKEGVKDPGVFITRNPERFKILERSSGDFYGATDSAVGEFLGYEKKAREYYEKMSENDEIAREKTEEKIAELEQKGEVPQGYEQYLKLIAYIPYPDEKHIEQAIKKGEKRYQLLENNPVGRKLIKELEKETDGKDPVKSGL